MGLGHRWGIGLRLAWGLGSWCPCYVLGPVLTPSGRALSYLKWEPLVSYNGCLGPIDDLGEGQLPARAEKHRDAASLGGRGVTGEPSFTLHTLPPTPVSSQQLLLLGVRSKEERKVGFFWGGELFCRG